MITTETTIKRKFVPKIPDSGCPPGTFKGIDTCFCEDHCSWEICRLINPPKDCLSRIDGGAAWLWDDIEDAWTAQGNTGLKISHYSRRLINEIESINLT